MQWHNVKTNELQSEKPGKTIVDQEYWLSVYSDWVQVADDFKPPTSLDELKTTKLRQIDTWTAQHITSGFTSATTGTSHTYDSDKEDQSNLMLMLQAAQSSDFATHPVYQGHIPIRAIPEGQTEKVILQHNAEQMQQVVNDMAMHIGACKQQGWQLQSAVSETTTKEELELIAWPE